MRVHKFPTLSPVFLSIFIVVICMIGVSAANVQAATFTVMNTNDSGDGSLRQAIADANAAGGADTIDFDAGVFATSQTITLTTGELVINGEVTINGPGADSLTISGNNVSLVFFVSSGAMVTISDLTISHGSDSLAGGIGNSGTLTINNSILSGNRSGAEGGGIRNSGTLTLNNSILSGNGAGFEGGGIWNSGPLTINNSTLSGNVTQGAGGGIYHDRGTLIISNSSLTGNNSDFDGGGISNSGTTILNKSTLSNNSAGKTGGGIRNSGSLTINDSTLSGNQAADGGGINGGATIRNSTLTLNSARDAGGGIVGAASLNNSIVANNSARNGGPDVFGVVSSGDYNFIGSTSNISGISGTHNITGGDPMLGPLADNGGPTKTHMPLPGSPVIDKGTNPDSLATDQRGSGFLRTRNDAAVSDAEGGDGTDVGAVESNYLVVNTTAQDDDGACQPLADGDCTLREAIIAANAAPGTETIIFDIPTTDPGYDSIADRYTITLTTELPALDSDVSINGLSAKHLTVKRDATATAFRIFTVNNEKTVMIGGLTISGGLADQGGGISNAGTLTLTACDFRDNRTKDGVDKSDSSSAFAENAGSGGAIYNEGRLVVNFSSFSSNRTGNGGNASASAIGPGNISANGGDGGRGGAIYNSAGSLVVRNSTFSNNRAGDGGTAGAFTSVLNAFAFARGGDGGQGGAIYNLSSLSIANTTITDNGVGQAGTGHASSTHGFASDSDGNAGTGSLFNRDSFATLVLDSTIVANTNGSEDISGNVSDGDYNLVEHMTGILPGTHNITGVDPKLGLLADNGGPTMTHALLCGSPAIDQGKNFGSSVTDQRGAGFDRTWDDPGMANAAGGDGTDIGAFELQAPPVCNTAPVASDNSYSINEDAPLTVAASGVLGNDTDGEGDSLTAVLISGPSNAQSFSLNPNGSFSYTPNANFNGSDSFTYKANDGSLDSNTATVTITVNPVNDAPVVSATPESQSVQYSDPISAVTVTAADLDSTTLTPSTTFNVGGGAFGSGLPSGISLGSQTCTPSGSGTGCQWTLSGKANVVAGTYVIRVKVSDGEFAPTSDVTLIVNKEKTETVYTGDVFMFTAGPTVTTANVRLSAQLTQQADGNAGDITKAKVSFLLFKSTNLGATPDLTVSGVPVDATGAALKFVNLGVDTWTIKVKIDADNGYWKASPVGMGTIAVEQPTNELRTSGGGWVADAQSINGKGNFGFNVDNQKKGVRGGSVYLFRGLDGFNYLIKNTSWQSGGIGFSAEGTTLSKAAFSGKCVVQKIDSDTGEVVDSFGNYSFTVDVRDGDLFNPRQADKYAITVLNSNGLVWRQIGSRTSPPVIGGGNITVKAK